MDGYRIIYIERQQTINVPNSDTIIDLSKFLSIMNLL